MRPYLAVLHDSLREAMHSRVLWLLLGLIVLGLLALAPLTIEYPPTTDIGSSDVVDLSDFAVALEEASQEPEDHPARIIYDKLPDELQEDLSELANLKDGDEFDSIFSTRMSLVRALGEIVEDPGSLDGADLSQVETGKEVEQLSALGSEPALMRRNRLIIQACFPGQLESRNGQSAQVRYLVWPLGTQLPFGQAQMERTIDFVLAQFVNFLLGFVGVFVGILVTASIVPNTFNTGSVNLLVSKPISRAFLYLTKVIGGCWFVLINATLIVIGVYLIAGFRLGVWNIRMMWCIPLFLFVFIIYYSVSAFAGLVWRNTIVAISLAVLCWLLCTIVGTTYHAIRAFQLQPKQLTSVFRGADQLFSETESGRFQRWNDTSKSWEATFTDSQAETVPAFVQGDDLIGPVYSRSMQQLVGIEDSWSGGDVYVGDAEKEYARERIGKAPAGIRYLIEGNNGELFCVHKKGIARFEKQDSEKTPIVMGIQLPGLGKKSPFVRLGPPKFRLSDRGGAAIHPTRAVAVSVDKGRVRRFELEEGEFRETHSVEFGSEDLSSLVGLGGDAVVVGTSNGQIGMFEAANLKLLATFKPRRDTPVKRIAISSDGLWIAVLFHDGYVWLFDCDENKQRSSRIPQQGGIATCRFDGQSLLLVDDSDRVQEYNPTASTAEELASPQRDLLERVQKYVIGPLYQVFPKPGQLGDTTTYLLTESTAIPTESRQRDLRVSRPTIDPWGPVWSSGFFAIAMLGLGCLYISRQEF